MSGSEAPLGALLLLLLCSGSIKSSGYVYKEVIVPRQLKGTIPFQKEADVSYILKVEGRHRIVHLKHMTFVVPNMPVYSYNMKGDRIADYPYIQDDCYYNGYVEDIADSQVVLSICSGLWGHVQIESLSYEIEPIKTSLTFQHLIYRRAQEKHDPCRGILDDEANLTNDLAQITMAEKANQDPFDRTGYNLDYHPSHRYLEFYAVVDRSKSFIKRKNETQLVQDILLVMAQVHSIYLEIGLHVYLVGLELWMERDYIVIGKTLSETLKEFQTYATYQLMHRVHFDHSSLMTTKGQRLGISSGEHYCQYNHASVSVIRSVGSLRLDADQIAHELGHSLGFFHDDLGRHCDCLCSKKPGVCIMHSKYGTGVCRRLSNCSRHVYYDLIRKPGKECLLNKPSKVVKQHLCGNGVVDSQEECDCGRDEECRNRGCCQTSCKFRPGADCLDGLCCVNCKHLPEGTMCRRAGTECDLAEYCRGTMADCPPDVYKQDGTPCGSQNSCYMGQCSDLQQQCIALFGREANLAPLSCFEEVNMRGDRSGNCGELGLKFKKCKKEDALCGRLQCTNIENIPRLVTGQAILQTPGGQITCWGTEFHQDDQDGADLGAVRDGSTCGTNKICINKTCVSREVLRYDCDLNRCHNRGVCNNRRNCHCTYGWAPPFCEGKGYGGSIDSGPPPVYSSNLALIIAIAALIGVVLVAVLVISVLKREQLTAWFARSTKKQESPQSESIPDLQDTPEDTPESIPEPILEPIPEPAPTPATEPLPQPRHTSGVKRTPSQRTSNAKLTPSRRSSVEKHPPQPDPIPQLQHTPAPEPLPQPRHTSGVKRTPSQRTSNAKLTPSRRSSAEKHPPQPEPTPQLQHTPPSEPRLPPEQTKVKWKPAQKPSRRSS